jgi:hypothetical protein
MIDPRGLTVTGWCDAVSQTLNRYGPIPILQDPDLWPDWAYAVLQLPIVDGKRAPGPRGFDNWQDWALRFNETVPY